MKIGSTDRVMVRPLALLVLACAASLFSGVEGAAAQSNAIDEAVNAHGVTATLELTPAQRSAIYQEVHKDTSKVAPAGLPLVSVPMCRLRSSSIRCRTIFKPTVRKSSCTSSATRSRSQSAALQPHD
jgi:hypothetical protein